jgi:TolB-like protein/cytochrome c-type biogenesis protein CcmH/NrfG
MSADAYQRKMSEALKILNAPREIVPEPAPTRASPRRSLLTTGLVAVVLVVAAGIWWDQQRPPPAPAPSTNEAASASPLTIAVLPFDNMSNDPEQEFFSDGIAEDILNELARNTSLVVRPRASAFALKGSTLDLPGIGQRLNVTHVLTGSVRRSGEGIRVTVQLSEVDGNRSIWSDRYDRELTDIFVVQDEITREILTALNAQFVRRTAPRKFVGGEAYEAFLLGRHHLNTFNLDEATHWLKIATDLDPTNADAWGDLVRVSAVMTSLGLIPNSGETLRERTEYIERALNIDPTQPDALGVKALDTFNEDRDYQASIDQLAELVRMNPNHAEAHMYLSYALSGIGQYVLAERVASRATQLDPLEPSILANHFGILLYSGAVEEARQALDVYEVRIGELTALYVFDVAWAEGDVAAMQAALGYASMVGPLSPVYAALIPHVRGDQAAVHEILRPLKESTQYVSPFVQSRVALIEGRLDDALNHWREAIQAGDPAAILFGGSQYPWRKAFPEFYAQTAYQQMLVEFGLDPESLSKIAVPELLF